MENVLQENDRLLTQALSVEIMNIFVHENMKSVCFNVTACARCVTTESELKLDFLKKECYETLLQKYQTLEKHCITLEINNQLNTEIFQRDTLFSHESAPTFAELLEINDLKAQAQAKDTVILKLKEKLNSLNGDVKERKVKREVEEIETLNIELDHKTESSTEQAFGSQYPVQPDELNLSGTTIVEVPKELPKVSMRDTWSSQESALTFAELFEIHNLKAQAQAKDTVILKLKEKLNSFNGDVKERKVKRDIEEIETLNIELDRK
nr:hypothetical protein [Tanacetum cinerariifolium]